MVDKEIKIYWSKRAVSDLKLVYDFYFDKSPQAATKIVSTIISTVEELVFVDQYQEDEILKAPYRRIMIKHHRIVYRPTKKGITVLKIFDNRQSPKKLKK